MKILQSIGTYKGVIEGAHEFAHRFTEGDSRADYNKPSYDENGMLVDYPNWNEDFETKRRADFDTFFDELDSTYAEMLCTDFLEQKYSTNLEGLLPGRIEELKDVAEPNPYLGTDKLSYLKLMTQYSQFLNKTPLTPETLESHKDIIKALNDRLMGSSKSSIMDKNILDIPMGIATFQSNASLSHQISFLLNNHLHETVNMDNPEQAASTLRTMIDINSLSSDFNEEQADLLLQLGLPFSKTPDGKLTMTTDGVSKINASLDRTLDRYQELVMSKSSPTMENGALSSEQEGRVVGEQSSRDKVKEQFLETLNNPVSREKREEANAQLAPNIEITKDKGEEEEIG